MKEQSRSSITTITVPKQLSKEFKNLPDEIRLRYLNFSEFGRNAIREKLERCRNE